MAGRRRSHWASLGASLTVLALALWLIPSAYAMPTTKRVVEQVYEGFRGVAQEGHYATPSLPGSPAISFKSRADERFVRVTITDQVGEDVRAFVWYDAVGNGQPDRTFDICGKSQRIPIPPKVVVRVDLYVGTCADGTTSTPTKGVIKAVFFRRR